MSHPAVVLVVVFSDEPVVLSQVYCGPNGLDADKHPCRSRNSPPPMILFIAGKEAIASERNLRTVSPLSWEPLLTTVKTALGHSFKTPRHEWGQVLWRAEMTEGWHFLVWREESFWDRIGLLSILRLHRSFWTCQQLAMIHFVRFVTMSLAWFQEKTSTTPSPGSLASCPWNHTVCYVHQQQFLLCNNHCVFSCAKKEQEINQRCINYKSVTTAAQDVISTRSHRHDDIHSTFIQPEPLRNSRWSQDNCVH